MTETASGPARGSRSKGTKASKGMRIERVHTTPGVHPYDEVVWERRDVVMTNWRDGSVNFEQRGVEFPDFWSVNAVNIVTSKYFRGAVGTPQRETGLKQLIDRIVKTYRKAGEDHGYFASPADAEIFEHDARLRPPATRSSASTRRCGSTSARRSPSRSPPASSCPSTTPWNRSSTGTRKRA